MKRLAAVLSIVAFLLVMPGASFADSNAEQQISLAQAIQNAQKNSIDLIRAANAQQQAKKTFENTTINDFTPVTTGASNPYVPLQTDIMAQLNPMKYNNNWQNSTKQLSYLKDKITYLTMKNYFGVQDAIKAEAVAEKSLQQAQVAYDNTMAKKNVGMATDSDLETAKAALDGAKSALVNAKSAIDNAYVALDTLIGLDTNVRPVLQTQIDYQSDTFYKAIGLDGAISRAISNSPVVYNDQININYQNTNQYYNTVPDVGPLQYQDAQNTLNQDKQIVTQQATSDYMAIDTAEKAYAAAQKALAATQLAYKNTQANYNAGISTKQDLITAETTLEQKKLAVAQALHNIYYARGQLSLDMGVGHILPVNLPGM